MSEKKERGLQYILFVAAILAVIFVAIFLKPAAPQKSDISARKATPATTVESPESKTDSAEQEIAFESLPPAKQPDTSNSISKSVAYDTNTIRNWYEDLLREYTSDTDHISTHHDVVIRYYRKPLDGKKVDKLKDLGFYIHERPTKKALQDLYTNTIYYGDSVRREDVLVVAYQLIRSGIKLQAIEHSRFGDNWKSHSIELGTDTTMLQNPELTLDTIRYIVENNPYIKVRM